MNNDDFISLKEDEMVEFFKMDENQLKHTLFAFAEAKDNKWTGRSFIMLLDDGRYYTERKIKAGYKRNIKDIKKQLPLTLLSQTIMPGNIMHLVWQQPQGI